MSEPKDSEAESLSSALSASPTQKLLAPRPKLVPLSVVLDDSGTIQLVNSETKITLDDVKAVDFHIPVVRKVSPMINAQPKLPTPLFNKPVQLNDKRKHTSDNHSSYSPRTISKKRKRSSSNSVSSTSSQSEIEISSESLSSYSSNSSSQSHSYRHNPHKKHKIISHHSRHLPPQLPSSKRPKSSFPDKMRIMN